MVFHFFIFTISISKRKISGSELERAYRTQINERLVEENKQRCITKQRML